MKMAPFTFIIAAIIGVAGLAAGPDEAFSQDLRSRIVNMEHADSVWAIDKYRTVIKPKNTLSGNPTEKFRIELFNLLLSCGGIEIQATPKDRFTGRSQHRWLNTHLIKGDGKFKHPTTGRTIYFLGNDKYYYRIRNIVVIDRYLIKKRKDSSGGYDTFIKKIILQHQTPQNLVYKSEVVNKQNIEIPAEGMMDLGAFSRGPLAGIEPGDIIQYLVLLGNAFGEKNIWIIPRNNGLVEVNPIDAFYYLAATKSEKQELYFHCSNPSRPFVIKKKGYDLETFHRDLTGLNYHPMGPAGSSHNFGLADNDASLITQQEKDLVQKAIGFKQDFQSQSTQAENHVVLYNGLLSPGCEYVTIQTFVTHPKTSSKISQHDYRVCRSGKVERLDKIFVSELPDEVEKAMNTVAAKAQQDGRAQNIYLDYVLQGRAVRDSSECSVQVKVFKDSHLVEIRTIDGCS